MKTEREMFVKKYREVFKVDKSLFVNDNGEFIDEFCQSVYEIWQSRVPEGYVVVPADPTERMLDSAYSSISDNLHKTQLLAAEAEVARLQSGIDELKKTCIKVLGLGISNEFERGWDRAHHRVLRTIEEITGADK